MTLKQNIILPFLLLIATTSCKRTMTQEELIKYINNPKNGLVQERNINGVNIKVTYRPTELLVYQELHGRDSISEEEIREARERYGKQHYFVLALSQGGKEILSDAANKQRFSMLVNQFAFDMGNNVFLTTDEMDTLQVLDFVYPRYFGMAASTDILFVFDKQKNKTDYLTIHLNEFGLNTGNTMFRFSQHSINKSNVLKFKNNQFCSK